MTRKVDPVGTRRTLAILTTHPIQYQVPLWQELTRRNHVPIEVWYLTAQGHQPGFDRGFGRTVAWDLEMLSGYRYQFLQTRPASADINRFRGARIGSLGQMFEEQRVAALLINGWYPQAYWQAVWQADRAGVPVLLRAETNGLLRPPWWKAAGRRRALAWLFGRISRFLAIGAANRRFYLDHGVPAQRIGFAPYCVDNRRFRDAALADRARKALLRERWGIPQDGVCFLFCGKLIPKKRVEDLLGAFEIVARRQRERPVHLLIVGDGPLRRLVSQKAEGLQGAGGRPCVSMAGFLNQREMPGAYAAADCLVLPSDASETWGLVVNEAMACGLPALVSDRVGCGPDLIDPGRTGDIFPMGDRNRLADVLAAWSDPARCEGAQPAVSHKIAGYSIERAADGILDAFVSVGRSPRQVAMQVG